MPASTTMRDSGGRSASALQIANTETAAIDARIDNAAISNAKMSVSLSAMLGFDIAPFTAGSESGRRRGCALFSEKLAGRCALGARGGLSLTASG
jgi:hypothetical protein